MSFCNGASLQMWQLHDTPNRSDRTLQIVNDLGAEPLRPLNRWGRWGRWGRPICTGGSRTARTADPAGAAPSGSSPRLRLQSPPTRAESGRAGGLRTCSPRVYVPGGLRQSRLPKRYVAPLGSVSSLWKEVIYYSPKKKSFEPEQSVWWYREQG